MLRGLILLCALLQVDYLSASVPFDNQSNLAEPVQVMTLSMSSTRDEDSNEFPVPFQISKSDNKFDDDGIAQLASLAPNEVAQRADTGDAQALVQLLEPVQQLRARFKQVMHDANNELIDQSAGSVIWQRPMLFRWDIKEPFIQSIVVDGDKHYQYDADLEQLIVQSLADEAAALPRAILSGDVEVVQQYYTVRQVHAVAQSSALQEKKTSASGIFKLRPLDADHELREILLVFDNGMLQEMSVLDSLGQISSFQLFEQSTDAIEKEDFEIQTTEHTEVIYQ